MMSWIGQLTNIPDNPEKLNIFKTVSHCVFTMCQLALFDLLYLAVLGATKTKQYNMYIRP